MKQQFSISLPCLSSRGVNSLCGLFFLGYCGLSLYVLLSPKEPVSYLLVVPFTLFAVFSGWAGFELLLRTLATVHLVPEGIAVTILGKTIRRYPAGQLGLFYLPPTHLNHPEGQLCVSLHTTEGLIALREAHLCRKKSGSAEVSLKKQRPNWKVWFLKDQLRAEKRKSWLNPFRRDFLWIEYSPELVQILRTAYPQVPWLDHRIPAHPLYADWRDPQTASFCRGFCKEKDRTAMAVLARLFQLPFPCVLIWMLLDPGPASAGDRLSLLLPYFCLAALFEGIWRLTQFEFDVLHISPEQLHFTRKGKELACLPAWEIRHIYTGRYRVKGGYTRYIAVSTLKPDALAAQIEVRCHTPESRMMIRAFRQVPQADRLIISWYLTRRLGLGGLIPVPDMQILTHTPAREQILREAYPEAQWHDLPPTECL